MQVRASEPQKPSQWLIFDDVNVDNWDVKNLEKDCFGGKTTLDHDQFKVRLAGGPWVLTRECSEGKPSLRLTCVLLVLGSLPHLLIGHSGVLSPLPHADWHCGGAKLVRGGSPMCRELHAVHFCGCQLTLMSPCLAVAGV